MTNKYKNIYDKLEKHQDHIKILEKDLNRAITVLQIYTNHAKVHTENKIANKKIIMKKQQKDNK